MKRLCKTIALLVVMIEAGASLSPAAVSDDPPLVTVHRLAQKMQEIAAPGWAVAYDEKLKVIEITRKELTSISGNTPNPAPGDNDTSIDHFSFWLWVTPLVSKAQYARQASENRQTEKKIAEVYARLLASPTVGGIQRPHGPVVVPSEPHSNNPTDQKSIAEYERLKQSLHQLPDSYFGNVSIRWSDGFPKSLFGPAPSDEKVREECVQLYRRLSAVPTAY